MPLSFSCPRCGRYFDKIRKEFLGKKIQCHCGRILRLADGNRTGSANSRHSQDTDPADSMAKTIIADDLLSDPLHDSIEVTVVEEQHHDAEVKVLKVIADEVWNAKIIEFPSDKVRHSKGQHRYEELDRKDKKTSETPPQIPLARPLDDLESLPPVKSAAAATPVIPPIRSATGIPQYHRPPWATAPSRTSTTTSALVALVSAIGLFQCLIVGALAIAVVASHASGLKHAENIENTLMAEIILRIVVGMVLLIATVGFGLFLIMSLFSAGEEIQEGGTVRRKSVSTSTAIAAAGYLLLLLGMFVTIAMTSTALENQEVASRLIGIYWPTTLAELLAAGLLLAIIPIIVLFTGILRVLDS